MFPNCCSGARLNELLWPRLVKLGSRLPAIVLADAKTSERFWEFFAANIHNRNTRPAFMIEKYKAIISSEDF